MDQAPYALGFRTSDVEHDATPLPVRGTLPRWLGGTLLRTGPARFEVGAREYNHWFDGLAMLHRFSFAGGRVTYASRFLQSESYRAAMREGRIVHPEFATDPCRTLFGRVAAVFRPLAIDNGNINVVRSGGACLALTETTHRQAFDPATLAREPDPHPVAVKGQLTTAHPAYDAARGVSYNYVLRFSRRSEYQIVATHEPSGDATVLARISADEPSYMHSFGMSDNHLVLTMSPLVVDPMRLLLGARPFIANYRWRPERGMRVLVIAKDDGRIVRDATAPACFTFHHVNARETDGAILADLITYPDASVIDQLYLRHLRSAAPVHATGALIRMRVPLNDDAITMSKLSGASIELPRIDERQIGGEHGAVFGAGTLHEDFLDSVVRIDARTGAAIHWSEPGCYPGEPVFVPAPDGDDGVLLSVVLDVRHAASFLLVLDAATLTEIARAPMAHPIPFGFHGNHFAD